jgi:hypothetical protein
MDEILNLKHGEAIKRFFELFFEPWMSEDDKIEFVMLTCETLGKTLIDLDNDLEHGIQRGYSIEDQLIIVETIIRMLQTVDDK